MPIYEYGCTACDHALEIIQKFSDAPLTDCPACGKSTLQKRMSAAAFHLKGGGWYQTDFKGGNTAPAKENEKSTAETPAPCEVSPSCANCPAATADA